MEDDEMVQAILRELRRMLEAVHAEVGKLNTSTTRLVEALEAEYKYRDRFETLQRERENEQHEELEEALDDLHELVEKQRIENDRTLDDLRQRVENAGASMRELPERILQLIEKEIYKLRSARWEALQSTSEREVTTPPGGAQAYRETGKIAVAAPDPEDVSLTPAQQRGLVLVAKRATNVAWKWGRWTLLPGAGWLAKWLHELFSATKNIGH